MGCLQNKIILRSKTGLSVDHNSQETGYLDMKLSGQEQFRKQQYFNTSDHIQYFTL